MYWIWLILCAEASKVAVYNLTPMQISRFEELAGFLKTTSGNDYLVRTFVEGLDDLEDFQPDWVIDYSSSSLQLQTNLRSFPHETSFVFTEMGLKCASENCSNLREPLTVWRHLAISIAEYFGWDKALAVVSTEFSLKLEDPMFTQINAREDAQKDYADLLVARVLRNEGLRVIFLMAGPSLTDTLLTSLAKYHLDTGFAYVLLGTNCQFNVSLFPSGLLCVALQGSEKAKDATEVEFWYILSALTHTPLTHWAISNLQSGQLHLVGEIVDDVVTLHSPVIFLSNLTAVSASKPLELVIGLTSMKYSIYTNKQESVYYTLDNFPLSTKNFSIQIKELDECTVLNPKTGGFPCMFEVNQKKVIYLLASEMGNGILEILQWQSTMKVRSPFINLNNSSPTLSNTSKFPNYVQLNQGTAYYILHISLIMKSLKYTKFELILESYFAPTYELMINTMAQRNVEVMTPKELSLFNSTDPEFCQKVAAYLKKSSIRPVFIFLLSSTFLNCILPAFKAEDLKAGDFVLINVYETYQTLASLAQPDQLENLDIVQDMLLVIWDSFINSLGQKVKADLETKLTSLRWSDCFIYDTMALALTAIDFAIKRGLNFYDWEEMIKAVRSVRLVGCTGSIAFAPDSNYRKDVDMGVYQSQEVEGQLADVQVMSSSITRSPFIYSVADMVWADGTSDLPSLYRLNYKSCPFPEEYRNTNTNSQQLTAAINWSFVALVFSASSIIYFKTAQKYVFALNTQPVLLATQDFIVIQSNFIELILLDLVGPGNGVLLTIAGNYIAFWTAYDLSDGTYFQILHGIFALSGIAIACVMAVILNRFKPFKFDLHLLSYFIIRPLSFIVVYLLTTTFDCSEADTNNPSLEDSVMDVDCFEKCWAGRHLRYVSAAICMLIVYVILPAFFASPLTNELDGLQFSVNAKYLIVKTQVIVTAIALSKTKALMPSLVHSLCFLGLYGALTFVSIRNSVFSIPQLNILHNITLGLFTSGYFSIILYQEAYRNFWLWVSFGLVLAISVSVYNALKIRKLQKLIETPDKVNIEALFSFAFRNQRLETM